jgi:RNA polymerase sigma-70 factor (ECF subfamily)
LGIFHIYNGYFTNVAESVTFFAMNRYNDNVHEFGTLYQDHRERLFHYLLRMTGDYDLSRDMMQECFTRCLARYGGRIDHVALLYRVAHNLVIDHKRKSDRNDVFNEQEAVNEISTDHQILVREQYRNVLVALNELSFADRELLSLVAAESLSYREIASIMATTENNIKVRVHRARKRLRSAVAKRGET